jgi:hypothetical protein
LKAKSIVTSLNCSFSESQSPKVPVQTVIQLRHPEKRPGDRTNLAGDIPKRRTRVAVEVSPRVKVKRVGPVHPHSSSTGMLDVCAEAQNWWEGVVIYILEQKAHRPHTTDSHVIRIVHLIVKAGAYDSIRFSDLFNVHCHAPDSMPIYPRVSRASRSIFDSSSTVYKPKPPPPSQPSLSPAAQPQQPSARYRNT